ncbi:MAG TPA: ABC transporter substrate-binding protein [Erysipelothrix sp.]
MKKNKKLIIITFVALTLCLMACGQKKDTQKNISKDEKTNDRVELDFWTFWGGGSRREVIEEIIQEFNDSQDAIEVKHKYQPWGDIWTKSLAAIAAGNPPDVIVQDINSVRQRAEAKQNTNIQSFLKSEDKERFYPQLWETALYEDEAYGLPFNTDTRVIFYNKKLMKEVGVSEEEMPTTWKEIEILAKKLDIKKDNKYERIGFYPMWHVEADTWALNADGGVSWFDDEEKVKIDTPYKVEALQWLIDWKKHYGTDTINQYEAEFGSGVADPFLSGLVAMRADNLNYYSNIMDNASEDFEFGVIQLPEREEGTGHWSWGGGFVVEIPFGAEHPEESFEFMNYLTSKNVQMKFGEKSFDIMANQEANLALVKGDSLDQTGKMIYAMADKNFRETTLTPTPLSAPGFQSVLKGYLDDILLGKTTPEKGLSDAQKAVEKLQE